MGLLLGAFFEIVKYSDDIVVDYHVSGMGLNVISFQMNCKLVNSKTMLRFLRTKFSEF